MSACIQALTTFVLAITILPRCEATEYRQHYNDTISINTSNELFDSILFTTDNMQLMQISFEIQLFSYCQTYSCNIFHFGDTEHAFPSFSINGITNEFELSIRDTKTILTYLVPKSTQLLPIDGTYHFIDISLTPTDVTIIINDTAYNYNASPNEISTNINRNVSFYSSDPWHNSLNATITHLCIKTNEIFCGDTVYGELLPGSMANHIYHFNLLSNAYVIFDACQSSFDTYILLLDSNYYIIYENDNSQKCATHFQSQLFIPDLPPDQYIFIIGAFGDSPESQDYAMYEVHIQCDHKESPYRVIEIGYDNNQYLYYPVRECQERYGTSLATVITSDDRFEVYNIMSRYEDSHYYSLDAFIGGYKNISTNNTCQWMDGTDNKYGQYDMTKMVSYFDSILIIRYNESDGPGVDWTEDDLDPLFAVCNAPKPEGRYSETNCTEKRNCWVKITNMNDLSPIMTAFSSREQIASEVPLIFWNSNLYFVRSNKIYYTKNSFQFDIFSQGFEWEELFYNYYNMTSDHGIIYKV
eukprot:279714_1